MLERKLQSPSNIWKKDYISTQRVRNSCWNHKTVSTILTRMQQLKAKLKEVNILAAMLSTHNGKHEKASPGAEAFFPIFLESYQVRQILEFTSTSTGRPMSRSTTCAPSFSISRILWYALLLEITISSLKFRVLTIMTLLGQKGSQESFRFVSKSTGTG